MKLMYIFVGCAFMIAITESQTTPDFSQVSRTLLSWIESLIASPNNAVPIPQLVALGTQISTAFASMGVCAVCKAVFAVLILGRKTRTLTTEIVANLTAPICELVLNFDSEICTGYMSRVMPIVFKIVDDGRPVVPGSFCGPLLQSKNLAACPYDDNRFEFRINLPERPPIQNSLTSSTETVKVAHFTDPHIETHYIVGGVEYCDAPTCCVEGARPTSASRPAGQWGAYGSCDTPLPAYLDSITDMHKRGSDFVVMTGDIGDHFIWKQTIDDTLDKIQTANKLMKDTFQTTPVYSILGNHEGYPTGCFAPSEITIPQFSSKWLYDNMVNDWGSEGNGWLPSDTFTTIRRAGYYTTMVPNTNLRIVALNSNLPYILNWWLSYRPGDYEGQLEWLKNVLLQAEQNNERVYILMHVCLGITDLVYTWNRECARIFDRFQFSIAGIFCGHTHTDEFRIQYDSIDDKPILVHWNGGGATTYIDYNMNYKIFEVDAKTFNPKDYSSYYYNMTEANLNPSQSPNWQLGYKFLDTYKVPNMTAESIHELVNKMAYGQPELLDVYIDLMSKMSDPGRTQLATAKTQPGFTYATDQLCNMVTIYIGENNKCYRLSNRYILYNSVIKYL